MRCTLHEIMVAEGARMLRTGLYDYGCMPHAFLRREAEVWSVCEEVQHAWLRGEIISPLAVDLLWEVVWRLRARIQ